MDSLDIRNKLWEIFLKFIDKILNPDFENKFIYSLFIFGSGCLGYKKILPMISNFEFIHEYFNISIFFLPQSNYIIDGIGVFSIIFSMYCFYQKHYSNKSKKLKYQNLKKAAPDILPILEDNKRIFMSFAPNSSSGHIDDLRNDTTTWEALKKNDVVPNNQKIFNILNNIISIQKNERNVVDDMKSHIQAFEEHCKNPYFDYSLHQFPIKFSDLIYQYASSNNKNEKNLKQYKEWLIDIIRNENIQIEKLIIFGSILYTDQINDFDVLLKTKTTDICEIKKQAEIFKNISRKFKERFLTKIHFTIFSDLEKEVYENFKNKLSNFEEETL